MMREHVALFEVMEGDAEDSNKERWKIRCGDQQREKTRYEDTNSYAFTGSVATSFGFPISRFPLIPHDHAHASLGEVLLNY